jgi:hypothetical protein
MNIRVIAAGAILIVLAAGFFFYMSTFMSRSNDPVELMRTVGTVSGGGAGLGLAMIVVGMFLRRKRA